METLIGRRSKAGSKMAEGMREFVSELLRGGLSNLTHAVVQRKYQTHMRKAALSSSEKAELRAVVERALLDCPSSNSSDDEPLSRKAEALRNREGSRKRQRQGSGGSSGESPSPRGKRGRIDSTGSDHRSETPPRARTGDRAPGGDSATPSDRETGHPLRNGGSGSSESGDMEGESEGDPRAGGRDPGPRLREWAPGVASRRGQGEKEEGRGVVPAGGRTTRGGDRAAESEGGVRGSQRKASSKQRKLALSEGEGSEGEEGSEEEEVWGAVKTKKQKSERGKQKAVKGSQSKAGSKQETVSEEEGSEESEGEEASRGDRKLPGKTAAGREGRGEGAPQAGRNGRGGQRRGSGEESGASSEEEPSEVGSQRSLDKAGSRGRGGRSGSEGSEGTGSSGGSNEEQEGNSGFARKKEKCHKAPSKGASSHERESGKDEHPSVRRLKRCLLACGVRRNYKKLFEGCRSHKSRVLALRRELEELGVQGNPTLEKCKAVRIRREEQAELASLDVSNIIVTEGRPRRRCGSAWMTQSPVPPGPPDAYRRSLGSGSDSGEEVPRKMTAWSNLRGLISEESSSD